MGAIFSAKGAVGREGFWPLWILPALAWLLVWGQPLLGTFVLTILAHPIICLFSRRLHDFGLGGWMLAPAWALIGAGLIYGVLKQLGATALAVITGWPNGHGLVDLGETGGFYPILAATVCFAVISLWLGLAPTRPPQAR